MWKKQKGLWVSEEQGTPAQKTADRPHWISILIGIVSPTVGIVALVISLQSLKISQQAMKVGQRGYLVISNGKLALGPASQFGRWHELLEDIRDGDANYRTVKYEFTIH